MQDGDYFLIIDGGKGRSYEIRYVLLQLLGTTPTLGRIISAFNYS